jgi:hypothetical protein
VRGRPAGFETTALINRDIHERRACSHITNHFAGHKLRRRSAATNNSTLSFVE